MKIIILGASGQLGREWQALFSEGNGDTEVIPYSSDQLDITDYDKTAEEIKKQRPDAVINCAAYTKVDQAESERGKAMKVNAEAVGQLAQICRSIDSRLVYFSTDYIFPGKKEDREKFPEGYAESDQADPVNCYGRTKWEGEQEVRRRMDNYLIIRISWLCGQFGKNFVKTMLNAGKQQKKLSVVNDQWGSPAFAGNVVENTFTLLKAGKTGTFHLTSLGMVTWYDLAREVFEMEGIDVELQGVSTAEYPTEAQRPYFSKLKTNKIASVPGVKLQNWKEGLAQLLSQL